jgi:hypothetical protein
MARVTAETWENYEEAISWMDRAVENLPDHFGAKGHLLSRTALWKGQLGDSSAAVELAAQYVQLVLFTLSFLLSLELMPTRTGLGWRSQPHLPSVPIFQRF